MIQPPRPEPEPHATEALPNYQPDLARRHSAAASSEDLSVPPNFRFSTSRQVTLALTVLDDRGEPIATNVQIAFLDGDSEHGAASLRQRTDGAGAWEGRFALPIHAKRLRVSASVIGIDPIRVVTLSETQDHYDVVIGPS